MKFRFFKLMFAKIAILKGRQIVDSVLILQILFFDDKNVYDI